MKFKKISSKVITYLLLVITLYQVSLSTFLLIFTYPNFFKRNQFVPFIIQESLVEKAIILYLNTIVNGFYGVSLLFKPSHKIKTIHLVIGLLIFIFSIFFVTRTKLTTDPLINLFV